jgi:hypothetical protein
MVARAFLLSLLLMNLGVAAWWALRTPPSDPLPPRTDAAVPGMRLLSEVEADTAGSLVDNEERDGAPEPVGGSDDQRCLQVGPFLTQADLRRAMGALTPSVNRIQYRESRVLAKRGHWVYLPAQGTREAALKSARELSARGLRDYYVVTAGDQENTISLGLFRDLANAEQRRDEVIALGFTPELRERNEEVPNYWIEIAVAPDFDWLARVGGYAGVEATAMECG